MYYCNNFNLCSNCRQFVSHFTRINHSGLQCQCNHLSNHCLSHLSAYPAVSCYPQQRRPSLHLKMCLSYLQAKRLYTRSALGFLLLLLYRMRHLLSHHPGITTRTTPNRLNITFFINQNRRLQSSPQAYRIY